MLNIGFLESDKTGSFPAIGVRRLAFLFLFFFKVQSQYQN